MTAQQRGLGRGLDALIRPDDPVRALPVGQLRPNRFQPRTDFNDEGISELADSIRAQGIVQPLIVTRGAGDSYTIIAGERRWRAARQAGLSEVPVVEREVSDDRELLELALVENLQRADLNSVEQAEAYRELNRRFGLSQDEIGSRVGMARTSITNLLRLLNLPAEVQDLLRAGQLTAGQARPLLGLADEESMIALANRAVKESLSARRVEEIVQPRPRAKRRPREQDVHTAAAADRLTRRLQTRVDIRRRGAKGRVQLHFGSEEELMRIYDLLMGAGG